MGQILFSLHLLQEPIELEEIVEGPAVQVEQSADNNVLLPADDLVDGLAAVHLLHQHQHQRDDDAESGNGPSRPLSPQSGMINTGTCVGVLCVRSHNT